MRRAVVIIAGATLALMPMGGVARADGQSPVRHEPGTEGQHSHHVHTGNGDCVDIASVLFIPAGHGLHRGANSSSFGNPNDPDTSRGPFHGTCSGLVYPGGPPVPFGPHH